MGRRSALFTAVVLAVMGLGIAVAAARPARPPAPKKDDDKKDDKKARPKPKPAAEAGAAADPPLDAWSAMWHTAAVVSYSSCPGTEPGHQEAFTLTVKANDKGITATEQPEQSLPRKLTGTPELRGPTWVLELRTTDGKNGMDVYLTDDDKLAGTRVIVRKGGKGALCSVVYTLEGQRPTAP
jgi:hypothetical protein